MYVDIFELTPSAQAPKNDCYSCLGCPHLQDITLNSSHGVYIECDLDEEEDKQCVKKKLLIKLLKQYF